MASSTSEKVKMYGHLLFNGTPGSIEQKDANLWLIKFQSQPDAYRTCFDLLFQNQEAFYFQCTLIQVLRTSIAASWKQYSIEIKREIRSNMLKLVDFVQQLSIHPNGETLLRLTRALVAKVICLELWVGWKGDISRAYSQNMNEMLLLFSLLPHEMQGLVIQGLLPEELQIQSMIVAALSHDRNDVNLIRNALGCLQNWIDWASSVQYFGFSIIQINSTGLLDLLLNMVLYHDSRVAVNSARVLVDILSFEGKAYGAEPESEVSREEDVEVTLVLKVATLVLNEWRNELLLSKTQILAKYSDASSRAFQDSTSEERLVYLPFAISLVVACLAEHHAAALWAPGWFHYKRVLHNCPAEFQSSWLTLVCECTSFPVLCVSQLMLEFWYFCWQVSPKWESHCRCIGQFGYKRSTTGYQNFDAMLHQVVDHIIEFMVKMFNLIPFSDDDESDMLDDFRREGSEAISGICTSAHTSCLKTIVRLIFNASNVVQAEAAVFSLCAATNNDEFEADDDDEESSLGSSRILHPVLDVEEILIPIFQRLKEFPRSMPLAKAEMRLLSSIGVFFAHNSAALILASELVICNLPLCGIFGAKVLAKLAKLGRSWELGQRLLQWHDSLVIPDVGIANLSPDVLGFALQSILYSGSELNFEQLKDLTSHLIQPLADQLEKSTDLSVVLSCSYILSMAFAGLDASPENSYWCLSEVLSSSYLRKVQDIRWEEEEKFRNSINKFLDEALKVLSPAHIFSNGLLSMLDLSIGLYAKFPSDISIFFPLQQLIKRVHQTDSSVLSCRRVLEVVNLVFLTSIGIDIESGRPIVEMYDTLRLKNIDGLLPYDSIEAYFGWLTLVARMFPDVFDSTTQRSSCSLFSAAEVASVLYSVQIIETDTIKALTRFFGVISKSPSSFGSSIIPILRNIATPLARAMLWTSSRPEYATVRIQVSKLMFQLLHRSKEFPEISHTFGAQSLAVIFNEDIGFQQSLNCGPNQMKILLAAILHTRNERQFCSFWVELSKFFCKEISFTDIHLPRNRNIRTGSDRPKTALW